MRDCRHIGMAVKVLLVWCVAFVLSACASGADYRVHVVDPAVTNHMILKDGPLPPVCKESTTMELFACRGEYEPASFVVTASKPLDGVVIEVGQLAGPGGRWAKEAVDVRVVKDYWRGVATPTLLVHDESFLAIEPAPTEQDPKAMKMVAKGELRDTAELQPVSIEARKQFWITVHVPEQAKPGTYTTTVRIVPQNSDASELTLQVQVYPFDLLAPMLEYSIYYPSYLLPAGQTSDTFGQLTAEQMKLEFANMVAHGLTNPNFYNGPSRREDGSVDFSLIDRIVDLRESVGMRPKVLHLLSHGAVLKEGTLTPEERERTRRAVQQIDAWAWRRGYDEVFYAACDEWWGERLSREHDSMLAVQEAGGKVFVAVMHPGYFDRVGDVLHRPVMAAKIGTHLELAGKKYTPEERLRHMAEIAKAGTFERKRQDPEFRKAIDGVHRYGNKVFTYMNPTAGEPYPELQRRNEGLGLWRIGFDGTMTWAYTHIQSDKVNQPMIFGKVYRTDEGVLDTLHWEGWREGVDDVRYLTTLLDAQNRARGRFPDDPLITETDRWVNGIDVANGDLNAIRREMARRTVALADLGYKEVPADQVLAGVDVDRVQIVAFPEPWRFKLDPDDVGVRQKWFGTAADESDWGTMRTDTTDKGWGQDPGFGWYRTELPLTARDAGRKFKYLYFGACDEDSRIYLNGEQILDHSFETTGLPAAEIWLKAFVVPLNDVAVRGGDLLAVRVHNSGGMGGIWRPVRVVLSDQKLNKRQIEALIELKTAKD